ncbi:S8 family serine peptidase [Pontibacter sp. SGAir0037]|uniref:S8 family serine peptidase n=1 Tax=Pontibacter sp. SGAir0037 TaxID=2571030 RepID=UPI0010CD582B|nr:S8 family serine peptidase [Pontibacter sp. SGAir0037]QCR24230.1 peptidase S8 [Pontibacter sp. SGAir0037]
MKLRSLWLVVYSFAIAVPVLAQNAPKPVYVNSKALAQLAATEEKAYRANRTKAIELAKERGWVIEKHLSDGSYIALQGLDSRGLPIYYITHNNTRAAATTKTDQLWPGGSTGLNLSGASNSVNQKMALWDGGGVRTTHQELTGRIEQKDTPKTDALNNDHATHVAGTLIASGVNPLAKGMAFGVKKLSAYDFNSDLSEMAAAAPNLLISNHSYGSIAGWRYNSDRKGTDEDPYWEWWGDTDISQTEDYKFGYYDETTAKWDQVAYNAPYYLIVKSAGNSRSENGPAAGAPYFQRSKSGNFTLVKSRPNNISSNNSYDIISTYGNAKNILTVGAVAPISGGYSKPSDVQSSSFSSYGPTDDGRIKPDLVGNGSSVLSSSGESNRSYMSSSGTSMAAPNIAGTLLLLQEHYSNIKNGSLMRAATLKGLAIHTADEAGSQPGPDYMYGWGLLNAARAAAAISNTNQTHLIQERTLANNQTYTFEVTASGAGPLVVTISWTDPEATALAASLNNRSPRLVNDLDLRITGRNTTYMPWILDPANPAQAASRGDNKLDNVEQVLIADAVPGEKYTVTISHKGTISKGPQAYSILASGIGGTAYCTNTGTATTGARINRLVLGTSTVAMPATCATYRDLTSNIFSFEPGQAQTISLQLSDCSTESAKMAKVFIDWNGDGDFNDAGETAATSGVINGSGTFNASVTAPFALTAGYKTRMRIVVEETTNAANVVACGTTQRGETQDYLVQFTQPLTDIGISQVTLAGTSTCATPTQSVVVKLRNYGTAAQSNILVSVIVRRSGTQIAQLSGLYSGTLSPNNEDELLLANSFATEANVTYELEANATLAGDVITTNNSSSYRFTASGVEDLPQASIYRCGASDFYTLSGKGNGTVFWFNSQSATEPFAAGNLLQLPVSQVGSTVYASLNEFSGQLGPKTKSFASNGGYNQFSPDVRIQANGALVLESARLYIGNSGKITFTVFNSDGSPVSTKTLTVTATRTTPGPDALPDDPADAGAVYYLGLVIPEAGEYRIAISYENGATIFRNNAGVTGYPFQIPNIVAITGNTATTTPESYYYYFYDLKVSALGCKSDRIPVSIQTGTSIEKPSLERAGQTLVSSQAIGNRWYLDGRPIEGATGQVYTPKESGTYSVLVMKDGCVSEMSLAYTFDYKPEIRELGSELVVSPNPGTGRFRIELETHEHQDILIDVTDMLGRSIYTSQVANYYGQYNGFIEIGNHPAGVYILRVRHGNVVESQKLVLRK